MVERYRTWFSSIDSKTMMIRLNNRFSTIFALTKNMAEVLLQRVAKNICSDDLKNFNLSMFDEFHTVFVTQFSRI